MKRAMWFIGFSAAFALAMGCVFSGTWGLGKAFIQPDQAVVYGADFVAAYFSEVFGGGTFVPGDLRYVLGGPYFWQELQYALAMYLAALGMAYYLKGRGVGELERYSAAMAYGLMGYNFTLFSAGHLGWFVFLTYGPFMFGLINRAVRKGKIRNWILLGGVMAWASTRQPDLWLLFALMAFGYGVFALFGNKPNGKTFLGIAITVVTFAAVGWPSIYNAAVVQTGNRDKQIAESSGVEKKGDLTPAEKAAEAEKRWVFCTNWSLPPNETLEFVMPEVNGGSSDHRVSAGNIYRGRIGMLVAPGRWQPYRQHSLYMGMFTVAFALLGMIFAWKKERDVKFWTIAGGLVLVCAFGGFTPFYRLIYKLPMGDYIRCPVKFVHLLEWCVAALAGFGTAVAIGFARRRNGFAGQAIPAAVAALMAVNAISLAVTDAKYCAVDVGDTVRIAIARESGSADIGFVMNGEMPVGENAYLIGGGTAFRDNAALKDALAKGVYRPVSYWAVSGKDCVKVARERAQFALLERNDAKKRKMPEFRPAAISFVSFGFTLAVLVAGAFKLRNNKRKGK